MSSRLGECCGRGGAPAADRRSGAIRGGIGGGAGEDADHAVALLDGESLHLTQGAGARSRQPPGLEPRHRHPTDAGDIVQHWITGAALPALPAVNRTRRAAKEAGKSRDTVPGVEACLLDT